MNDALFTLKYVKYELSTNSDEFIELTKNPIRLIKKLNTLGLEMFLVKPDKAIARVSFITYYKQKLKEKGVDPSKSKTLPMST